MMWNTVANAGSYSVVPYFNGVAQDAVVTENTGYLDDDFFEEFTEPTDVTFTVQALAAPNDDLHSDGPVSEQSDKTHRLVQLPDPTGLKWEGTVAKWDAIEHANGYKVRLRLGFSTIGTSITIPKGAAPEHDFAGTFTETGDYMFSVLANGDSDYIKSNEGHGDATYHYTA